MCYSVDETQDNATTLTVKAMLLVEKKRKWMGIAAATKERRTLAEETDFRTPSGSSSIFLREAVKRSNSSSPHLSFKSLISQLVAGGLHSLLGGMESCGHALFVRSGVGICHKFIEAI